MEKRGLGTEVETRGLYVPGMLAGVKARSFRATGTSWESGRKQTAVGLKWKGMEFLLYPVSNWIALEVEITA